MKRHGPATAFSTASLVLLAVAMLMPFIWMVGTSLMDELEVFRVPPPLIPAPPRWRNYPEALTALPFGRFFLNSLVFSGCVVAGQVVTSALAAYALARLEFRGRGAVLALVLSVLMVPAIVLLIPRFLLISALGWVDTWPGLISTELVSAWGIFLMRQFFLTIPRELEEAARLDGAGEWTVFTRIVLPLSGPALATLALFSFVDAWKSFQWPLVATRSMEMRTVEVGVAAFHSFYYSNWPYQMAAATAAMVPIIIVFFAAQRYFVRGIQLTGLK
ncbi:MAG TPA: carbohydrate ABC transporter permease [Gemmatimonadales bacterium]|nr:carbohydrate ABC transporter permease [Gemmatimonadales bacterium]